MDGRVLGAQKGHSEEWRAARRITWAAPVGGEAWNRVRTIQALRPGKVWRGRRAESPRGRELTRLGQRLLRNLAARSAAGPPIHGRGEARSCCPPSPVPGGAHLAGKGPREEQLQSLPLQLHQAGVAILAPDAAVRSGGGAAAAARARGACAETWRAAQGARRAGANARGGGARGAREGARGRGARAGGRRPRRAERRARALGSGAAPGARLFVCFPVPAFGGEGRRGLGGRADFIHLRRRHTVSGAAGRLAPAPLPRAALLPARGPARHRGPGRAPTGAR